MTLSAPIFRFIAAVACMACITLAHAARTVVAPPLATGPYPVACSDVAYDPNRVAQIGGTPSDFWQGNPLLKLHRYFTDILLEPQDTIQINPLVPVDPGFYGLTWGRTVPYVVLVCYPTSVYNTRPDYALPNMAVVPHMQRAGDKPIFPPMQQVLPGQPDPNLLPLLVFSHGLAGSPLDGASLEVIGRLASFGYIVAAPFHGDARFSIVHVGNIGDLLLVLNDFNHFVEMEALRPLSLQATIDAMLANPDFGPRIDPAKIGGVGASMGGESMTLLLGAYVTDGFVSQNSHPTVTDLRIKAVVGYVPFAGENFLPAFGANNATAANVNAPYLAICGTADTKAPMARMQQAMNLFRNSHYMVALTGVPHGYDTSYAGDVFGWMIPFLDAFVKDDRTALANFLQQQSILGGLDDNVIIDYTLPGIVAAAPDPVMQTSWDAGAVDAGGLEPAVLYWRYSQGWR